ncbi:LysR family transcriptional regulator [Anianabacter salinae]|uniref:LysR family transcriptional regulator n=1 Tax=Anianabacter salinae TaxID=2851023 RepID=UPI00225DF7B1|nr:LysR family transcriptional regulator [Anianabacter salinae]
MNWAAISFDWNHVRAFLATVEEGSLSAAARALGSTQPTLGRQIAQLQDELGVTLFQRVGRSLTPTPAALDLAGHVREMGEAATRLSLAATGQSQSVEGRVRITASQMYSVHLLPPIVARLRAEYPLLRLEVVASDSLSDLRRREADIAIRNARPTDNDLIARLIREDAAQLYAHDSYLERLGPVRGPADMGGAEFIGFSDSTPLIERLQKRGFPVSEANFHVGADNHLANWALACAGLGIGIVPTSVGDAAPGMRQVLPETRPFLFPIWLVAPQELRTSRRVRAVFDRLADALAGREENAGPGANALDAPRRGA